MPGTSPAGSTGSCPTSTSKAPHSSGRRHHLPDSLMLPGGSTSRERKAPEHSARCPRTRTTAYTRTDVMVRKSWRIASEAFGRVRDQLEPTRAGRIWQRLRELGFINNALQFAALFTLGFIPFLNVVLAVLGSGLSRAILIRSGLSAQASHDVIMLFAHGRTAPASVPIPGLVLAVLGGAAISQMLQAWYVKIFRVQIHGWKAVARRVEWLAGVFGFVALQVVIGRRIGSAAGHITAASAQFLLAAGFLWWSPHCLLAGQFPWRRLFLTG